MQEAKRGRGRLPTGRTTAMVRIPIVLKPAVAALVVDYRAARQRALDAAPLKQPAAQPEQAIIRQSVTGDGDEEGRR